MISHCTPSSRTVPWFCILHRMFPLVLPPEASEWELNPDLRTYRSHKHTKWESISHCTRSIHTQHALQGDMVFILLLAAELLTHSVPSPQSSWPSSYSFTSENRRNRLFWLVSLSSRFCCTIFQAIPKAHRLPFPPLLAFMLFLVHIKHNSASGPQNHLETSSPDG